MSGTTLKERIHDEAAKRLKRSKRPQDRYLLLRRLGREEEAKKILESMSAGHRRRLTLSKI